MERLTMENLPEAPRIPPLKSFYLTIAGAGVQSLETRRLGVPCLTQTPMPPHILEEDEAVSQQRGGCLKNQDTWLLLLPPPPRPDSHTWGAVCRHAQTCQPDSSSSAPSLVLSAAPPHIGLPALMGMHANGVGERGRQDYSTLQLCHLQTSGTHGALVSPATKASTSGFPGCAGTQVLPPPFHLGGIYCPGSEESKTCPPPQHRHPWGQTQRCVEVQEDGPARCHHRALPRSTPSGLGITGNWGGGSFSPAR